MFKRFWWVGILILAGGCGLLPQSPSPTAAPALATETEAAFLILPTATPTEMPAQTPATETPLPTATLPPTSTPAPTLAPTPTFAYDIQLGSPRTMPDLKSAERGCQWMGVAGQVFDADGQPVEGVVVVVKGDLAGNPFNGLGLAGLARDYGPGGYEIMLAERPIASSGSLIAQVFTPEWEPISPPYSLSTFASCEENLIVLNFQGIAPIRRVYLPALSNGD